jgi:hypothetical protein
VPDANADETQSGTRLIANYYVGGDGSRQFAYFTDSARSGDLCVFQTAGDGALRCLPSGAYYIASEFSDSACSRPVAESTTCSAPKYVIQSVAGTGGACTEATHVYSVGGAVTALYTMSAGSCVSVGAPPAGYTYVGVGAEILPSAFQQATIQAN